jgi:hypothetical protein
MKKLLIIPLLLLSDLLFGQADSLNGVVRVGTTPNDKTGMNLRTAMMHINGQFHHDSTRWKQEIAAIVLTGGSTDTTHLRTDINNLKASSIDTVTLGTALTARDKEYNVIDYGVDNTGAVDATTAINNACNAAHAVGGKVIGSGTFKISNSIVIRSNADFSGATFNITDNTKTAVVWGDSTDVLIGKVVIFPKIAQLAARTAGTWTGSDIGIKILNGDACTFFVRDIRDFKTGLLISTYGTHGSVYSTYIGGYIAGCQVDLKLSPATDNGWANDNTFINMDLSSFSSDGSAVVGTRALLIDSCTNDINNNLFLKLGLEGDLWQYNVECMGMQNTFAQCRWESTIPKMKYTESTVKSNHPQYNKIDGGYNSRNIVITRGNGCDYNTLWAENSLSIDGNPGFTGNNPEGAEYPTFTVKYLSGDNPLTEYGFAAGYNTVQGKLKADSNPRWQFNNATGELKSGVINYVLDNSVGSNDTYTATITGFIYVTGKVITFHPLTLNTGACSLNINGGGAIAIKTQANGDPANSDMVATGYYPLCWNGSNWVLMTK